MAQIQWIGSDKEWFEKNLGRGGAIPLKPRQEVSQQPPSSEPSKEVLASGSAPQEWVDQVFQEAREQMSSFNPECLEAFKRGDRIGLLFEGSPQFQPINEQRLALALNSNQGSDESSIVDCFMKFTASCHYITREQFVWDWVSYHQQNHGRGYGRTYKDHFALVKFLRSYPDLQSRLAKLDEIAKDADSFGNGSLALVYPAYFYALRVGEEPVEFVRYLTSFTHANRDAMNAVTLLCHFIERPQLMEQCCPASENELITSYKETSSLTAYNTLMAAVFIANADTEMEAIRRGVYVGGDTDSNLATALLLWHLQHMAG